VFRKRINIILKPENLLFTLFDYKNILWTISVACVTAYTHTNANWLCIYVRQK